MASRTKQKEEARARRLAEEQARAEQARRNRRLQMLGGVLIVALVVVAVAIAVSSGGGSNGAKKVANLKPGQTCKSATDSAVCTMLNGIPEHGSTLGSPNAPVTVTEYGDLECPICADFATGGIESQLISNDVKSGRVKLVYKSLETATGGAPNPGMFGPQQAAAYAAGRQGKAWYYIEFFYHYQGAEGTNYVTPAYLQKLAKHVPGLKLSQWLSDSQSQPLLTQVTNENRTAVGYLTQIGATSQGQVSTPTLTIVGPKGQAPPIIGVPGSYSDLESAVKSVS
jgi:protein-disulfide isomerase